MAQPFRKILSPVDFDENSLAALDYARLLAQHYGGIIYLLHVVPTEAHSLLADEYQPKEELFRPQEQGEDAVEWPEQVAQEKLHSLAQERLGGVPYKIFTHFGGDPATIILEMERNLGVDVIVMATHGRTGIAQFVLGSVADKVVRESSRPVLTIRGE